MTDYPMEPQLKKLQTDSKHLLDLAIKLNEHLKKSSLFHERMECHEIFRISNYLSILSDYLLEVYYLDSYDDSQNILECIMDEFDSTDDFKNIFHYTFIKMTIDNMEQHNLELIYIRDFKTHIQKVKDQLELLLKSEFEYCPFYFIKFKTDNEIRKKDCELKNKEFKETSLGLLDEIKQTLNVLENNEYAMSL